MSRRGARPLTVTAAAAAAGTVLLGGPLRLRGWSLNSGTAPQELQADASAAAPAAGANITTLSLPNGTYNISWTFELTGTPGAADVDNVKLLIGSTRIDTSDNPGTVGDYGPFLTACVVSGGVTTLKAAAIGAATAGTTYTVKITATPTNPSLATVNDSGQQLATVAIPQGSAVVSHFGDEGLDVENSISVLATQGTVQGTLWYDLLPEYEHPDRRDHKPGG